LKFKKWRHNKFVTRPTERNHCHAGRRRKGQAILSLEFC
jgi:hypothetical protein